MRRLVTARALLGRRAGRALDGNRPADEHERAPIAERSRLVEHETDRQQTDAGGGVSSFRREHHARGARAQLEQRRLRLGAAFGEDQDGAAVAQGGGRGVEEGRVARRVGAGLLTPMDRQRAEEPEERTDERMREERRVRERAEPAGHDGDQQHRIDDGVVVVRGHDERPRERDVLRSHHLDPAVEHLEQ